MGVRISPAWPSTRSNMKIVCISDTHAVIEFKDLPDGDMLIHAGDLSLVGEVHEIQHTLAWLRKFPHKYKIFIGGNHDNALAEFGTNLFSEQLKPYKDRTPLIYLQGSIIDIEGLKVFGSAVIPHNDAFRAGARAFMLDSTTNRHWSLAPRCDILITHGAPAHMRDGGYGDPILMNYVQQIKPKLHVFGHIHTAHGVTEFGETTFVNAVSLHMDYRTPWEPIVVDI